MGKARHFLPAPIDPQFSQHVRIGRGAVADGKGGDDILRLACFGARKTQGGYRKHSGGGLKQFLFHLEFLSREALSPQSGSEIFINFTNEYNSDIISKNPN
ncbi:MAG: hypothetical protein KAH44_23180 [Oricola sp.]|nr:hypothetical protein [Oricola sp.]